MLIRLFNFQHGRFSLSDLEVVHLAISEIKKSGYDFKGRGQKTFILNQMSYEEINTLSSQERPYTIIGWKRGESEPLISVNQGFYIEGDGRVYTIDYESGVVREGRDNNGDIYISLKRKYTPGDSYNNFPWEFTIEANQGGVLETDEAYRDVHVAPDGGYVSNWSIKYPSEAGRWKDEVEKNFFVKSRNGKNYAIIDLSAFPAYGGNGKDVGIFLVARLNPNNSRNLQYSKVYCSNKNQLCNTLYYCNIE